MKKKRLVTYILFFVVVALLFWLGVFWGTDNWKEKPVELNAVQPFEFRTQDNKPFTEHDLLGKVTVVEFFFTNCRGICPILNTNMHKVYDDFKSEPDFQIMSNTCDPDRDTVARLKVYSDSLKVDNKIWKFLTGRKDSLYSAARKSFLLDDPKNNMQKIEDQFLHTQFWAVIDKNGIVRGEIFDGLKKSDIEEMDKLIQTLLKEKIGPSEKNFIVGG